MKKIYLMAAALALVAASSFASADASTETATGSTATSNSNSDAVATSGSGGNTQDITFTSPDHQSTDTYIHGTQTVKNVPAISAPALTTSNDTCMGSSSGGLSIAGFGVTGGTTWTDANCKRLKNSRELWNMGMKAAALALMCKDPENREALEVTGFECPDAKSKQAAAK